MTLNESTVQKPLLPVYSDSPITNTAGPYRVVQNTEFISQHKFPLIEMPNSFSAWYRFPRINEDERTLVELVIKNQLVSDEQSSVTNNRITIQGPQSVVFKNLQVCLIKS